MALIGATIIERIINFLRSKGLNDFGIAGVLGNLFAESGLNSRNLQNTYEKKFGMTDQQYTDAVDNGTYTNFIYDKAGYGLCQWTYWSRKQNLLNFAKERKYFLRLFKLGLILHQRADKAYARNLGNE